MIICLTINVQNICKDTMMYIMINERIIIGFSFDDAITLNFPPILIRTR